MTSRARLSILLAVIATVLMAVDPGVGESKRPATAGINAAGSRETPPGNSAAGQAHGNPAPGENGEPSEGEPPGNSDFGRAQGNETPGEVRATAPSKSDETAEIPADESIPAAVADALAATDAPKLGVTITAAPASGVVRVKVPGTRAFTTLTDGASLPVGTIFDATRGEIVVRTAVTGGRQDATFGGGKFEVRQPKRGGGMTDVFLRGSLAGCRRARAARRGPVAFSAKRRSTVRRLWARDRNGRFRSHGITSIATVRGTRWLTEDRCDGTLTKVREGAVDVKPRRGGRTVRVRAGRSLLVRRSR